jgi:hypothetical protein
MRGFDPHALGLGVEAEDSQGRDDAGDAAEE